MNDRHIPSNQDLADALAEWDRVDTLREGERLEQSARRRAETIGSVVRAARAVLAAYETIRESWCGDSVNLNGVDWVCTKPADHCEHDRHPQSPPKTSCFVSQDRFENDNGSDQ